MVTGSGNVMDQQREKSLTMDDLYGDGKAYPDPYNAGAFFVLVCLVFVFVWWLFFVHFLALNEYFSSLCRLLVPRKWAMLLYPFAFPGCLLLFSFCSFHLYTGKLPNNLVHERYRKRYNRESFIYSVRFRVGPFGITFDNKVRKLHKRRRSSFYLCLGYHYLFGAVVTELHNDPSYISRDPTFYLLLFFFNSHRSVTAHLCRIW